MKNKKQHNIQKQCEQCNNDLSEIKIKRTFLGFHKIICPKCNHKNIYPLGSGYRVFYIILVIIFAFWFLVALSTGTILFPGLLLVAAAVAIYKDSSMRKLNK